MPDGVGAGSAGIGDDGDRTPNAESVGQVERLPLRLVVQRSSRLAAEGMWPGDCLVIVVLAQTHPAAGSAEHEGQVIGRCPAGLSPRFVRGEQEQFGGAVEPANTPCGQESLREGRGQGHLAGHLHALTSHVEDRDWLNGDAAGAESCRIRLPTGAERGDDARAGSDDTRSWSGAIFRWKKHDRLIFRRGS